MLSSYTESRPGHCLPSQAVWVYKDTARCHWYSRCSLFTLSSAVCWSSTHSFTYYHTLYHYLSNWWKTVSGWWWHCLFFANFYLSLSSHSKKTSKRRLLRDRKQRHRKYSQESEATMPVDQPAPDTSKTYDLLVPDGIQSPADVTAVSKKRKLTKSTSCSNKRSSKHKRKCRTKHNHCMRNLALVRRSVLWIVTWPCLHREDSMVITVLILWPDAVLYWPHPL